MLLLELAANNDLDKFRQCIETGACRVNDRGPWYGRLNTTGPPLVENVTPAMVAALNGSLDVLSYILSFYRPCAADINERGGVDGSSALHYAAASGSPLSSDLCLLLLRCGADPEVQDDFGRRPGDVISDSPKVSHIRTALHHLLNGPPPCFEPGVNNAPVFSEGVDSSPSPLPSSPPRAPSTHSKPLPVPGSPHGHREYPPDANAPDVTSSVYTTDEFRMYSFKVRPCSRAYSHDWTECPFVHPGENARRRDPRKCHYSCVPCPDFRKGACRRGDACEFAHGVFECWLHPAQYRTRLCKDLTDCARRVCFFAHSQEELRPVNPAWSLTVQGGGGGLPPLVSPGSSPAERQSLSPPLSVPSSPQSVLSAPPYSPRGDLHSPRGSFERSKPWLPAWPGTQGPGASPFAQVPSISAASSFSGVSTFSGVSAFSAAPSVAIPPGAFPGPRSGSGGGGGGSCRASLLSRESRSTDPEGLLTPMAALSFNNDHRTCPDARGRGRRRGALAVQIPRMEEEAGFGPTTTPDFEGLPRQHMPYSTFARESAAALERFGPSSAPGLLARGRSWAEERGGGVFPERRIGGYPQWSLPHIKLDWQPRSEDLERSAPQGLRRQRTVPETEPDISWVSGILEPGPG